MCRGGWVFDMSHLVQKVEDINTILRIDGKGMDEERGTLAPLHTT